MLRQWDVPSGLSESTSDTMIGKQDRKMDCNEKSGFSMFQVAWLSTVSGASKGRLSLFHFHDAISAGMEKRLGWSIGWSKVCMFSASYFDLKWKPWKPLYITVDVPVLCVCVWSNTNQSSPGHLSLSQISRGLEAILNLRILASTTFRTLRLKSIHRLRCYWGQHLLGITTPLTTVLFHLLISK